MTKRDLIIDNAAWLFAHKGFRDTATSELAELAGVAEGTIFYHFGNKERLFLAVLENIKSRILAEFDTYFSEASFENGVEMALGAVSFYIYLAGRLESRFLLLHRTFPYELARSNPVCRETLEAIYNAVADIFEDAVARGIEDRSIAPDVNPRKTGLLLFTMADGLVRFKTNNLYDAGALYGELMASCRRMIEGRSGCASGESTQSGQVGPC